jgi:hypothetical protein
MNDENFGVLRDVSLRQAWRDEAVNFTPWLASNLGRLGEAIGMPLELIQAEAPLPTSDDWFSADIHARNIDDNTSVLIENQLEKSDHTHLGQILTYLAGLEARTVIWLAPQFREAHLAAIKWLNEHTTQEYSFFAVKIRIVQIGSSPLAPLFEVVEKPNAWERRQQSSARAAKQLGEVGQKRSRFWTQFFNSYEKHSGDGGTGGHSTQWKRWRGGKLIIAYYVAKEGVGVFLRGDSGVTTDEIGEYLGPYRDELEKRLEARFGPVDGHFFGKRFPCDYSNDSDFQSAAEWINFEITRYAEILDDVISADD